MDTYRDFIIDAINKYLPKSQHEWELVGFINKQKEIFTFGNDSKIIGRLFEVVAADSLLKAAKELGYKLFESTEQTVYPDFYFLKPNGRKIAIDIKTTYRKSSTSKFGFTGGSFTSYMRNGTKNIVGNYSDYDGHYIIGVVYSREENPSRGRYSIENLDNIVPAYKDIEVFVQEKFRICGDKKGSGNTDNIGTIQAKSLKPFIYGIGPFSFLGKEVFEEYWKGYPKNTEINPIKEKIKQKEKEKEKQLRNNLSGKSKKEIESAIKESKKRIKKDFIDKAIEAGEINYVDLVTFINYISKKDENRATLLKERYEEYLNIYNTVEKELD